MVKVDLKDISKEANLLAEYFISKTNARVKTRGKLVEVEGVTDKVAKLLLHKFLHHNGFDDYRVVVAHLGLIEVLPPEPITPRVSSHSEGSPPTAPATMPYYFPGSGAPVPPTKKRKK